MEISNLKLINKDLSKKAQVLKRELSILPELRLQLGSMKENIGVVEQEIEGEKLKNISLH